MEMLLHVLEHTVEHVIGIIPFLFLTYLVMEYIEHKAGDKVQRAIEKTGPFGPVIGAVAGAVPQCGFSTAASNLYAGRVITLGTLMAIYLSTSDEMLPILISNKVEAGLILKLLGIKVVIGMLAGLAIDFAMRLWEQRQVSGQEQVVDCHVGHNHEEHGRGNHAQGHEGEQVQVADCQMNHSREEHGHGNHAQGHEEHGRVHGQELDAHGHVHGQEHDAHGHVHGQEHDAHDAHGHSHNHSHDHSHTHIHELCERENCHCERGVFYSAVIHTVHITLYILVITFVLNLVIEFVGEDALSNLLLNRPVVGQLVAGVVGLIPNCASSVVITQLFLDGALGLGAMMAGLLVNAGVGVLVLFRVNHNKKENLGIVALLYAIGVVAGIILDLL